MNTGVKSSQREEDPDPSIDNNYETPATEYAPSQGTTNTSGLPLLPDELLLEILSCFPRIPQPSDPKDMTETETYIARRDTLLALSRTCRYLRKFFLPYVWQRIEARVGMPINIDLVHGRGKAGDEVLAGYLVRQLHIATVQNPTLAQHVEVLDVDVPDFAHKVVVALSRSLTHFNNLHTIKMRMFASLTMDQSAKSAFLEHSYPQIRTTFLSAVAYPVLKSCPNVRYIQCLDRYAFGTLLDCFPLCSRIETLKCLLDPLELQRGKSEAAKDLPNVREIGIVLGKAHCAPGFRIEDKLKSLLIMKSLRTIILHLGSGCPIPERERILDIVQQQLVALQEWDGGEKRICVQLGNFDSWSRPADQVVVIPARAQVAA